MVVACVGALPAGQPMLTSPSPLLATVQPALTAPPTAATPGATITPTAAPTAAPPTAGPTPTPAPPTPTPTPLVVDPRPKPGKFAMDISRPNAFVRQVTTAMCVPASMQIMINLMSDAAPDRSRETQMSLYTLARGYSPWITPERDGASANGWAAGLEHLGYGDFEPMSLSSMGEALKVAARQMRYTEKPVGLLVWRGDHAWVMSGFKATADPAFTDDFEVTSVWIEDPWFGRTDRTWGTGLAPHSLVSTTDLADDFVSWSSRYFWSAWGTSSRYVIVAPRS
jgi:hypothetical protein